MRHDISKSHNAGLLLCWWGILWSSGIYGSQIACINPVNVDYASETVARLLGNEPAAGSGSLVFVERPYAQIFRAWGGSDGLTWERFHPEELANVVGTYDFGSAGLLLASAKGLYLTQTSAGKTTLKLFHRDQTGSIASTSEIPGKGLLVVASNGLFMVDSQNGALRIQESQPKLPLFPVTAEVTALARTEWLPGMGWLIRNTHSEYFLAQLTNDQLLLRNVAIKDNGFGSPWGETYPIEGLGVLVNDPETGMTLVRIIDGQVRIDPVGEQVVQGIRKLTWVRQLGLFIDTGYATLLAKLDKLPIDVQLAARTETGIPSLKTDLPDGSELISASNGLYNAHTVKEKVRLELVSRKIAARDLSLVSNNSVLIATEEGLLSARIVDGSTRLETIHLDFKKEEARLPRVTVIGNSTIVSTDEGLFVAQGSGNSAVKFEKRSGEGTISQSVTAIRKLPGPRWLVFAKDGLFLAEAENDRLRLADTGIPGVSHAQKPVDLPGVGMLMSTSSGPLVIRTGNEFKVELAGYIGGQVIGDIVPSGPNQWLVAGAAGLFSLSVGSTHSILKRVTNDAIGHIDEFQPFGNLGWLAHSEKGLFFLQNKDGQIAFNQVGNLGTGLIGKVQDVGEAGYLFESDGKLLLANRTDLSQAYVSSVNGTSLYGNPPESDLDSPIDFSIQHPCAATFQQFGLTADLAAPGGQKLTLGDRLANFAVAGQKITMTARLPIHVLGTWKLQFYLQNGSSKLSVGSPQEMIFSSSQSQRAFYSKLSYWGTAVLALINLILFLAARRWPPAWRVVVDKSIPTAAFRVFTVALSHIRPAQLWILDLYFVALKRSLSPEMPFLSLPLSGDDDTVTADKLVAPPWRNRRVWIQGNSGMGKSALYRHLIDKHFRSCKNAFEANRKWGCVLVAFSARDFASGGSDETTPDWVVAAIKNTLSQRQLTFDDDTLLRRMLRTGVIGVAIDGLHEAGRTRSVEAFASAFAVAPIFVTSQEPASPMFEHFRLPIDMRAYTLELLRLYLGKHDADVVMKRIVDSGLSESISSGYDVRLIVDIVKSNARSAPLPSDRMGLYDIVVRSGWPRVSAEAYRDQLDRASAAAWRIVSERKPNEDKRRFVPNVDLAQDLLEALAEAPERHRTPVRLMRKVGTAFEFVHDQMHSFLAARWFTQKDFNCKELQAMVASSTIWSDSSPARRTLWNFAAAMLDDERLLSLWQRVEDQDEWDILRRELKREAEHRGYQSAATAQAVSVGTGVHS
jgi:hypothetical protein